MVPYQHLVEDSNVFDALPTTLGCLPDLDRYATDTMALNVGEADIGEGDTSFDDSGDAQDVSAVTEAFEPALDTHCEAASMLSSTAAYSDENRANESQSDTPPTQTTPSLAAERMRLETIIQQTSTPSLLSVLVLALPLSVTAKLAHLFAQHGNLVFIPGDAKLVRSIRDHFNCTDPIFDTDVSEPLEADSRPGRSVLQDTADIVFMYEQLQAYLPAEYVRGITDWDPDSWSRRRNGKTGANYAREGLVWQWHNLRTMGGIQRLEDVFEKEIARVRRRRAECVLEMRGACAIDNGERAYLTDVEVACVVNIGCSDYIYPREIHGDEDQNEDEDEGWGLLETLARSEEHAKVEGDNPTPMWVESMDEQDALDPNAYEPCCCGLAALIAVYEYRCEMEPGYDPGTACHVQYPLRFLYPLEVEQIWACRAAGEEDEPRIPTHPRSQTILQECDRHAMVSNNLFVLVDSSVDATNARFNDPDGPLPAPGLKWSSKYNIGDNIGPGHLLVPYEDLAPRCIHGLLHPLFEGYCATCFPYWKHDNCVECEEYSATNS
jgi:hypothetical protein